MNAKKIGAVAVFLSLISAMCVTGGIEHLPPNPSTEQIVALAGAGFLALIMGLFGINLLNDE